jgi:hypothetical protein
VIIVLGIIKEACLMREATYFETVRSFDIQNASACHSFGFCTESLEIDYRKTA